MSNLITIYPVRHNSFTGFLILKKEWMINMIKEKEIEIIEKEYLKDLQKIKETIKNNQAKAMVAVNSELIKTYYETGTIINQRKVWGNKYIERLSIDLKTYGKGYSTTNLKRMAQLAASVSIDEFRAQPVPQIGWSHLITILQKTKSHEELLWYINKTYEFGWSRTILLNKIKMKSFELKAIDFNNEIVLNDNKIDDIFNSTLVFDFIDRNNINCERDLEDNLLENITKFILELGKGFAYVGKQYKLEIQSKEYYPDLIFYNYILHSFVIIDLKMTPYKPEYLERRLKETK